MPVTKQSVTLTFQDPLGNPIAYGSVTFRLQVDISTGVASGPQVCAGRIVANSLDVNGSVTVLLWPTNVMLPASIYFVKCYTAQGQLAWSGELAVIQ